MRACALTPQKLIFFSPYAGKLEHEVPMHDVFNAMMWGSPGDHLYSHRADLDVHQLKEFARIYDLHLVLEERPVRDPWQRRKPVIRIRRPMSPPLIDATRAGHGLTTC